MLNGKNPLRAESSEFRRCGLNPISYNERYRFAACFSCQFACGTNDFHGNFFYRIITLFCCC